MKKIALILAGVLAVALPALAIQQLDLNLSPRLQATTGGLLLGPLSIFNSDSQINASRMTRSLGGSATIDFVSGTITCSDSTAITVAGARVGDTCHVGTPASPQANSTFTCYVSASNAVKVRHCPAGTAADPASATYYVRVISSQ